MTILVLELGMKGLELKERKASIGGRPPISGTNIRDSFRGLLFTTTYKGRHWASGLTFVSCCRFRPAFFPFFLSTIPLFTVRVTHILSTRAYELSPPLNLIYEWPDALAAQPGILVCNAKPLHRKIFINRFAKQSLKRLRPWVLERSDN